MIGAAELYVDANGGYTAKQAIRLGRTMTDPYEVTWFEEPVSSDDLNGLNRVRGAYRGDVAAGEYGYALDYFATMLHADAVDCLQADVTRCGGYTVWRQVAALAAANHLQISGHCAPTSTPPSPPPSPTSATSSTSTTTTASKPCSSTAPSPPAAGP